MMMSEFVERTGFEPSYEEYHFIEESYYEFDGNKDQFCIQHMKDRKSGKWDMELKFRKRLEAAEKKYEEVVKLRSEDIEFWSEYQVKMTEALNSKIQENAKLTASIEAYKKSNGMIYGYVRG